MDHDGAFQDALSENANTSTQASHSLLDISSNAVVLPPAESTAAVGNGAGSSSQQGDDYDSALQICDENEEENLHLVLAMNEAMGELTDQMIATAEAKLLENLKIQKEVEERKKLFNSEAAMVKRKVPVAMFMPPYFKDEFNMCPPLNIEMKRKMESMVYDPLLKEERKWNAADLQRLSRAVRNSLLENRLMPLYAQQDLLREKVRGANATTTTKERADWNYKLDTLERKIEFEKKRGDKDLFTGDYSGVDWSTIAMVQFKGQRTPASLQLKWCNEQAPQWNNDPWPPSELKQLKELARSSDFISWTLVANKLATRRSAWQCFEKYKSEISNEICKREWTQQEDDRLVQLVESLQLNGVVQWDKVTYHMSGRTRQQCRTRYMRTLDKAIKHGRWTDEEDLLLMCSIGRYGAKDWRKIAKGVPGRNDGQCRERWVNVLDRANRTEEWSMEEDEKLLYAVNMFGKGQWAKISTVLEGRNQRVCKARFRSLMTTKMRICAAQLSKIREAQASRKGSSRQHLKRRSDATFKEFNQLLGGDDETGESFCDQARSVAHTDSFRWKYVEPEVRRVVEEGMQDIAKKYDGRDRKWSEGSAGSYTEELFNSIEQSGMRAAKRERWLPTEFEDDVTEEQKCQRLTEALCQVIGHQDQQRSLAEQEAYASKAKAGVGEHLRKLLKDAVDTRVESAIRRAEVELEEEMPMTSKAAAALSRTRALEANMRREQQSAAAAAEDMLQPTPTTAHAAELFLAELPRIEQVATPLLSSHWSGEKLHSMDEVMARLEQSLKHHKEFVELRELLRCLLVEPLMLIYSLEDDDKKTAYLTEEFNRAKDRLMEEVEMGKVLQRASPAVKKAGAPKTRKTPAKAALKTPKSQSKKKPVEEDEEAPAPLEALPRPPPVNRASVWDDAGDDEGELPVDWEQEEEEAQPAAKTPSGRNSRAKKTPAARTPAAKRKAAVAKEEKPPVKKARTTRNSSKSVEKETAPAVEDTQEDTVTGDEEAAPAEDDTQEDTVTGDEEAALAEEDTQEDTVTGGEEAAPAEDDTQEDTVTGDEEAALAEEDTQDDTVTGDEEVFHEE